MSADIRLSSPEVLDAARANSRPRARLFRKYLLIFGAVISAAVFLSGALEIWFGYREQIQSQERVQEVESEAAAEAIDQFITEIQNEIGWATHLPWSDDTLAEQRRLDALRLLRQVPAISELRLIDQDGHEQLQVSRLAMDVVASGLDLSNEPFFTEAIASGPYFGPVYYRRGSEPYMTIAVGGTRRDNGVAVAEVNLKFIWDLISQVRIGETGIAYVVDSNGNLIAHPDISLVLRNTNLAGVKQVGAALARTIDAPTVSGVAVEANGAIAAAARIPRLDWTVLTELPTREALTPVFASVARTAGLLVLGIAVAVFAAISFARRMIVPIKQLEAGASRIGAGDLTQRIEVHTSDELEVLANEFNEMAARLGESRTELEQRVAERTVELADKTRELRIASEHKSQFLANMSHELRTPLNAILGFTELLLDGIYGELEAKTRQVVERLQSNGSHLLGLINDVLDLSKIEAGQLTLARRKFDLAATVRSVVESAEPLATAKGLTLRQRIAELLPEGDGDEMRLRQVFFNLISNAIKFTDSGTIEIEVVATRDSFEVTVTDTGQGIAADDIERVYEEFQQAGGLSNRNGTGLGLPISRRIVELHGGHIEIESWLGKGTSIRVVFPITGKLDGVSSFVEPIEAEA